MRIEVSVYCPKCKQETIFAFRMTADAGIFKHVLFACQNCGYHDHDWTRLETWQQLFLQRRKRVQKKAQDGQAPCRPKKPLRGSKNKP